MIDIKGPQWLYNAKLAIPVAVFVTLVKGLGLNMVIFIGAMKDVPDMYYEASEIDGASKLRQFFSITLPSIAPSIFLVTIITIIGSLKVFAQIDTLTEEAREPAHLYSFTISINRPSSTITSGMRRPYRLFYLPL